MKKLFILLSLIVLASCQNNYKPKATEICGNITYIKDLKTGLCFAAVNSSTYGGYLTTTITCVPCDSLKRVKVETIE